MGLGEEQRPQFFRAAGSRQMLAEAEKQLAFYREMLRKKAQGSRH